MQIGTKRNWKRSFEVESLDAFTVVLVLAAGAIGYLIGFLIHK